MPDTGTPIRDPNVSSLLLIKCEYCKQFQISFSFSILFTNIIVQIVGGTRSK